MTTGAEGQVPPELSNFIYIYIHIYIVKIKGIK